MISLIPTLLFFTLALLLGAPAGYLMARRGAL
jgi:hypothetical protein